MFAVHGGDIWCTAVLPWEESDSPWHQARESASWLSWRAENCWLWLVCACTFSKVRNHSAIKNSCCVCLLCAARNWISLLCASPPSPLCFEPIQTSYNVRDTGLPPSRDDWGPHPQWEGGPVVHRGPLLWMLGRQPPFWNCQPLRNIQKNYKGWCLGRECIKLMARLCWLGMNEVDFFFFTFAGSPCSNSIHIWESEFAILEIYHNLLILIVFLLRSMINLIFTPPYSKCI